MNDRSELFKKTIRAVIDEKITIAEAMEKLGIKMTVWVGLKVRAGSLRKKKAKMDAEIEEVG